MVLETTALPTELYPYTTGERFTNRFTRYGGEDGIRTHAALANPNDLANRPLQPLEYFSRLNYYFLRWRRGWDLHKCFAFAVFAAPSQLQTSHCSKVHRTFSRRSSPFGFESPLSYLWRRGWDSNPRPLSESLVFKTSSLNHSDTSPHAIYL